MDKLFEIEELSKDKLNSIGSLVKDLQMAELEVLKAEDELKALKEAARILSQELVPAAILGAGLSELRLDSGEKVIIKDELKPSIAKKRIFTAYEDMINQKLESNPELDKEDATKQIDSLFKCNLVIDKPSKEVEELLIEEGIIFDKPRSIHHATLKKYCQGLKDQGQKIPESISVFEYNSTTIKK